MVMWWAWNTNKDLLKSFEDPTNTTKVCKKYISGLTHQAKLRSAIEYIELWGGYCLLLA